MLHIEFRLIFADSWQDQFSCIRWMVRLEQAFQQTINNDVEKKSMNLKKLMELLKS